MRTFFKQVITLAHQLFIEIIMGGLYGIRALLGSYNSCRYELNCMSYAHIQLETQPLHRALINIFKRVATCHPFKKSCCLSDR